MTIRIDDQTIFLEGICRVEDAEPLLQAITSSPDAMADIGGATRIHLALIQILIAAQTPVKGVPADPFLRDRLRSLFTINPG